MTRALIYCRVSSAGQEDGSSLETQEARCRAYCDEHEYQVIAHHADTHTGAQYRERPGLSALREQVRAGIADVVVCYAIDRLSRHQAHLAIIAEEVEDAGARLEFVTEDFEDSAVGRFLRSARAFAAEIEREKISERTVRGRMARVQSGRPMAGAKPLYGYRWADEDKSRLVVHPDEAAVVRRVYGSYAAGATLRGISAELAAAGIPSPQGRPQWGSRTIAQMLRHPNYTGEAYGWFPRGKGSPQTGFDTADAIRLPDGTYPPIVSREEWQVAQQRLRTNKERAARNNRNPEGALLRGGIARCGLCGRALAVVNGAGKQAPYYKCPDSDRIAGQRCSVAMAVHLLDGDVWGKVRAVILNPDVVRAEIAAQQAGSEHGDVERVERELASIERRQANTAEAIGLAGDDDSVSFLTAQLTALSARKRELQMERANALAEQAAAAADTMHLYGLESIRERVAANIEHLTYREQRDLLDALSIRVEVFPVSDPQRVRVYGHGPFARL